MTTTFGPNKLEGFKVWTDVVWRRKVRDTREVHVEHQNRRRWLGERVLQFVPNP